MATPPYQGKTWLQQSEPVISPSKVHTNPTRR